MNEIELLEKARAGESLSRADKLALLRHLELTTDLTRAEMAQLLKTSERNVYRMLAEIRRELAEEARKEELLGRLKATYERVRSGLLSEIRSLPEGQRWRVWKALWEMEREYAETIAPLKLEEQLKELEELFHALQNVSSIPIATH